MAMPSYLRWYVNSTIDKNPLYDGRIGDVHIHLYRGAYSIDDIRLNKTTGNVPVPLFAAKRLDLAIQWKELLHRKLVGRVVMQNPELNFVDAGNESETQTGAGGPWLDMLRELTPFKLNAIIVQEGSIHFRAFQRDPPVDVYLSQLNASIENLTNVRDETAPLISTVNASALAKIVNDFVDRAIADPRVNWERKDVKRGGFTLRRGKSVEWSASEENVKNMKTHIVQFLSVATGGPAKYEGRDMKEVHANMRISNAEFDASIGDLKATLDKLAVSTPEQKELIAILESTRPQVVGER